MRMFLKYGHAASTEWPHLTGGYAEYIYLHPGTVVFRIPASVSDKGPYLNDVLKILGFLTPFPFTQPMSTIVKNKNCTL